MTGFATLAGEAQGWSWAWDIRSVNARGLDLRLRLPDWLDGLDQPVRSALAKAVTRGSVTLGLRLTRQESGEVENLNEAALNQVLHQLAQIESAAAEAGVSMAPSRAIDVLALRGILKTQGAAEDTAPLVAALIAQLPDLVSAFAEMRHTEGRALAAVLAGQLDDIAELTETAGSIADARREDWAAKLSANLAKVLQHSDGADPERVAQELAMITVKSDVTEEIDRLRAHVNAARELLLADGPIGRKLDFLSQEFNREANTLCAKAQATDLTRVGLDLKALIDQMREQVQNVE